MFLLKRQNYETETRFCCMVGTQSTLTKVKDVEGDVKVHEPVCVIESFVPSPMTMSIGLS